MDLFRLYGLVSVDTGRSEKALRDVDASAQKTTKSVTAAGDAAEQAGQKFDKSAGRMRDASGRFVAAGDGVTSSITKQRSAVAGLSSMLDDMAGSLTRTGRGLTAVLTLPILGAAAAIIAVGTKTSNALNQFQGVSQATADEMDQVRAKARELGKDLELPGTSAGDAALAMLELNKGNLTVKQSMDAANGSIQLARAAMVNEATAAEITASALNTYSLAADQSQRVSDGLANAANKSTGEIGDYAAGIAQAGMVSKASNVTFEETLAVLALMANSGVKGSDAGTSYKSFLLALRGPSEQAKKTLDALGVSAYDVSTKQLKPLPVIVEEFTRALGGLTDEARDAALDKIFGSDGARVAIALFSKGRRELDAYTAAMGESGTAARVAAANTKGLSGSWDNFVSVLSTLADDVFVDLEAPLQFVVQMFTSAVGVISDLWTSIGPGAKVAIVTVLALAASMGPLLVALGAVAGAVALISPAVLAVGLVIGGFALVATTAAAAIALAWKSNFGGIRDTVTSVMSELSSLWADIYPSLQSITQKALAFMGALWEQTGARIVAAGANAWRLVGAAFVAGVRVLSATVSILVRLIDGDWSGAWRKMKQVAVQAIVGFSEAVDMIAVAVFRALMRTLSAIGSFAERFYAAAIQLGRRLVGGVIQAIREAPSVIAGAIVRALVSAASLVSPEAIGIALGARLAVGIKSGIAGIKSGLMGAAADAGGGAAMTGFVQGGAGVGLNAGKAAGGGGLGNLGGKKGGGGGGGGSAGGESPAMKAAKLQLETMQIVQQGLARVYDRQAQDEEYFYSNGLTTLDTYVTMRKGLERGLLDQAMVVAKQELAIANLTKGSAGERAVAILKATDKIKEITENYQNNIADIDRKAIDDSLDMQRQAWSDKISLLEETASGFSAVYARMADEGTMSFAQAQSAVAGMQTEILLAQQKALQNQLESLNPASAAGQQLVSNLNIIAQKLANARAIIGMDAEEARRKDLRRALDYAADLRSVNESIVDMQIETADRRLAAIEQSTSDILRAGRMRLNFELQMEDLRARRVRESLEAEIAQERLKVQAKEQTAAMIEALNAKIVASDAASAARRAAITEDFLNQQREKLRGLAGDLADGISGAIKGGIEGGVRGALKSVTNDLFSWLDDIASQLLRSAAFELLKNVFNMKTAEDSKSGQAGAGPQGGIMGAIAKVLGINSARQDEAATQVAATVERTSAETRERIVGQLGVTAQDITLDADYNTDRILAALEKLDQTMESMRPAQGPGFFRTVLGAALSGAISGAASAGMGELFGGLGGGSRGGADEGPRTGRPTRPPVLRNDTPGAGFGRPRIVGRAGGGLLTGPGSGVSDSILALDPRNYMPTAFVSNGEYVIKAATVAKVGLSALDFMNMTGRLPERSTGGIVNEGPAYVPAPITARYGSGSQSSGRGEGGRPIVNVMLKPDAQGRIRSKSQVAVEMFGESNRARRDS